MENRLIWFNGDTVCRGTHPNMPNYDGHSRGRSYHLTSDGIKTKCNLKVDYLLMKHESPTKKCKICFK